MGDIEGGEQAPESIDLRVVAVDFGRDKEHGAQEYGESEPRDQRIRLDIELDNAFATRENFEQSSRQIVELREEGVDGLGEFGAVLDRQERRESHCDARCWMRRGRRFGRNCERGGNMLFTLYCHHRFGTTTPAHACSPRIKLELKLCSNSLA